MELWFSVIPWTSPSGRCVRGTGEGVKTDYTGVTVTALTVHSTALTFLVIHQQWTQVRGPIDSRAMSMVGQTTDNTLFEIQKLLH